MAYRASTKATSPPPKLSDVKSMSFSDLEKNDFILEHNKLNHTDFINIFIGENNAGKSRFLRELFKAEVKQLDIDSEIRVKLKEHLEPQVEQFRYSFAKTILKQISSAPMDSELLS